MPDEAIGVLIDYLDVQSVNQLRQTRRLARGLDALIIVDRIQAERLLRSLPGTTLEWVLYLPVPAIGELIDYLDVQSVNRLRQTRRFARELGDLIPEDRVEAKRLLRALPRAALAA